MNNFIHEDGSLLTFPHKLVSLNDPLSGMMSAAEGWTQASPDSFGQTGPESRKGLTLPSSYMVKKRYGHELCIMWT